MDGHWAFDPEQALQFFIKFTGLAKKTPKDRIASALTEEIVDILAATLAALEHLPQNLAGASLTTDATAEVRGALAAADGWQPGQGPPPPEITFPRATLEGLAARAASEDVTAPVAIVLRQGIDRHRELERRLRWLMNGTSLEQLRALDPIADCDQIYHALSSSFRVEGRVLELLSINRIAQSTATSTFFRSTKEAETNGVGRFYDTWNLLANFFEWGENSKRGAAAAERMRQIHGRYYIPNAGMKYVLLQTAFTWIDGIERIGHRPLLDVERRGFFHAHIKLGLAYNIGEINHDYDEMYGWYQEFNRANRKHHPLKRDTFERVVGNSMSGFQVPGMKEVLDVAARTAMDETYLEAMGYTAPSAAERDAVRAVLFTLGHTVNRLPYVPFIRSLQNNPAKTRYTQAGELGVSDRSVHMPVVDASRPNGGFPEHQRPIVTAGDIRPMELPVLDWQEVRRHNSAQSLWVVIDGEVYDLTVFADKHPGGLPALLKVAGRDASAAFARAGHSDVTKMFKLNFRIGRVPPPPESERLAGDAE